MKPEYAYQMTEVLLDLHGVRREYCLPISVGPAP